MKTGGVRDRWEQVKRGEKRMRRKLEKGRGLNVKRARDIRRMRVEPRMRGGDWGRPGDKKGEKGFKRGYGRGYGRVKDGSGQNGSAVGGSAVREERKGRKVVIEGGMGVVRKESQTEKKDRKNSQKAWEEMLKESKGKVDERKLIEEALRVQLKKLACTS